MEKINFNILKNEKSIDKSFEKMNEKGINFVFEQNPTLQKIGTREQYSNYLKTLFPESRIKNIVFHQTEKSTQDFEGSEWKMSRLGGAYFSFHNTKSGGLIAPLFQKVFPERTIAAVLDIKNPYKITRKENPNQQVQNINTLRKSVNLDQYDGIIGYANTLYNKGELDDLENLNKQDLTQKNNIEIVALKPEQIHILGSQTDIKSFDSFVKNTIYG